MKIKMDFFTVLLIHFVFIIDTFIIATTNIARCGEYHLSSKIYYSFLMYNSIVWNIFWKYAKANIHDTPVLIQVYFLIRKSMMLDKVCNEQVSMNIEQYKLFHGNRNSLLQKNFLCIFYSWNWCFTKWKNAQFSIFFYRNPLLLKLQLKFTFESWSNVGQKWLVLYCTKYMWLQILLYYSRNNSFIHDFRWNAHIRFIYLVNSFSNVVCYLPKR